MQLYYTSLSETIRKLPLVKAQTAFKKVKYGEKRFSIWLMELLHLAMWHDHDIDFVRWLHSAMACGSGIMTVNSPSGSTLQCGRWLWDDMPRNSPKRPLYWNSTSGFDFDYITAVDMSFCTSLRNFIQSDHPQQKKMTSCRFSRWRISAILHFKGPIMGSL